MLFFDQKGTIYFFQKLTILIYTFKNNPILSSLLKLLQQVHD